MKRLLIALLCLICVFTLVACSNDNVPNEPSNEDPKNTEWIVKIQPTCTESGVRERYVEGELVTETVEALGHDYGAWGVVNEATCTTDGKEERGCSRCSSKEERPIAARHTPKTALTYDENIHYHECEGCSEKLDVKEHSFTTAREDKYAYYFVGGIFYLERIKVGYVDIHSCEECDAVIKEATLVEKYNAPTSAYSEYAQDLGIPLENYNLLHGLHIEDKIEYIHFIYDEDYNISRMYATFTEDAGYVMEFDYIYENGILTRIDYAKDFNIKIDMTVLFEYTAGTTTASLIRSDKVRKTFFYNSEGALTKLEEYTYYDNRVLSREVLYNSYGYPESTTRWFFDVDGNPDGEGVKYQHIYTYDQSGNITEYKYRDIYDRHTTATYTYNADGNITSFVCESADAELLNRECYFEYDGGRLTKLTVDDVEITYSYSENKVEAYDKDNNLAIVIEYMTERKLAE